MHLSLPNRHFVLFLLLLFSPAVADITEAGSGIVFSDEHKFAFKLSAPPQWMFDNEPGHNPKGFDIIYPKSASWTSSPVVIYGIGVPKTPGLLPGLLRHDLEDFKREHGSASYVQELPDQLTADKRKAITRLFKGVDKGQELVAYIEMPSAWGVIRESVHLGSSVDLKAFHFVVGSFSSMPLDSFKRPETIEIGPMPR